MALPATDSFTTGSDNPLPTYSANWTANNGTITVRASTDDVYSNSTSAETCAHWNADSFSADQYAQGTINAISDGSYIGPAVRAAASGETYYGYYAADGDSYMFADVAGSWGQLGSTGAGVAATDVMRLDVEGVNPSTLTPKLNGSLDTSVGSDSTNSDIDSGSAGICGYGSFDGTRLDDWQADNLGVADLAIDVDDGATVADSPTIDPLILGDVSVSDALTVGDTPTVDLGAIGAYEVGVSDALTVADAVTITPLALADIAASDALTIGEDATPLLIEADLNADKGADDYANWVVGVRLYTP